MNIYEDRRFSKFQKEEDTDRNYKKTNQEKRNFVYIHGLDNCRKLKMFPVFCSDGI